MSGLTTVIIPAYVQTYLSAHITMSCINNILKYTNADEYEIILIHDEPKFPVRDDFKKFNSVPFKEIILKENTNYSTKMNIAAKEAKGKYLAFIQNDCLVQDDWLTDLRWYLENGHGDCIIPHQWPLTRAEYLEAKNASYEEMLNKGARDACMIMITKEGFEKAGGFNEELKAFVEADFYKRMSDNGVKQITTLKAPVTHISLATHMQDEKAFDEKMNHDSLIRNK